MNYLYETHLHTSQTSRCAVSAGGAYIRAYKDAGYTGIIVTDHFFHGNCVVDRSLPWPEWVRRFCLGYEDALAEGRKQGLDVFFGWENNFDGDDYLVYGLDREWLLEHPEVVRWNREEQFLQVRKYGGCIVHAHPFRQHYYIHTVYLAPYYIDAVETANAGNNEALYDAMADEYARILGLPAVAGSDIHNADDLLRSGPYGIELEEKLSSIDDYVRLLRKGKTAGNRIGLHIPRGRCGFSKAEGAAPLALKVRFVGRDENGVGKAVYMSFNNIAEHLEKAGLAWEL